MHVVKIQGKNEWWVAETLADIQDLSAKVSIDTGELVLYDEVEKLLGGMDPGMFHEDNFNVMVYGLQSESCDEYLPEPAEYPKPERTANAEYQIKHRAKQDNEGNRLLRVYVPIEYYDECYKFCKGMCDE